jgi:hypothetical protein
MSSYPREMLERASQLVAAKDALQAFMQGPGGIMLSPNAFNDIARAYGHFGVRYADCLELLKENQTDKEGT